MILDPHGQNIVAGPMLVYKLLLAVFGMHSAFPWRVILIGSFLVAAVMLFIYLRRRVGQLAALAGTLVVLFLGAAWEDLLWPFQINYLVAIAAGLGALVAFDRHDRRGDVITCALLVVAALFSSLGLPFLACFVVLILLDENRWRRLWVILAPAVLFAIWWLGWGHTAESAFSLGNVARSPIYVMNGFASSLAAVFGLASPTSETVAGGLEWGAPPLAVGVVLALVRIYKVGVSRQFWGILALGLTFWFLDAFNATEGRAPVSSRYALIGVIIVILLAAELLRGLQLPRKPAIWTLVLIGVATLASIASNVYYLHASYNSYHHTSILEKSALGAVEVARGHVAPNFLLSEEVTGTGYVSIEAGATLPPATSTARPATTRPNWRKRRNRAASTPTSCSSRGSRRRCSRPLPPNCRRAPRRPPPGPVNSWCPRRAASSPPRAKAAFPFWPSLPGAPT